MLSVSSDVCAWALQYTLNSAGAKIFHILYRDLRGELSLKLLYLPPFQKNFLIFTLISAALRRLNTVFDTCVSFTFLSINLDPLVAKMAASMSTTQASFVDDLANLCTVSTAT